MAKLPTVSDLMTPFPHSIGIDDDIVSAKMMMSDHDIRHLPVTDAGRVVGLVAESDIRAAGSAFADADPPTLSVRSVCTMPAYVVEPSASVETVVAEMVERQLSTVVVVDGDELVGIMTALDVCRALVDAVSA